jgi:hypothetical protein
LRKRRILQGISTLCCASFITVQGSLILWCLPTKGHWDSSTNSSMFFCFVRRQNVSANACRTTHVILPLHHHDAVVRHTQHDCHHDPAHSFHTNTAPTAPCHPTRAERSHPRYGYRGSSFDTSRTTANNISTMVYHSVYAEHYFRQSPFPNLSRRYCSTSTNTPLVKPACALVMATK